MTGGTTGADVKGNGEGRANSQTGQGVEQGGGA